MGSGGVPQGTVWAGREDRLSEPGGSAAFTGWWQWIYKEDSKGCGRGGRETKCVLPGLSERRSGGTCRVFRMEVIAEPPPGASLVVGGRSEDAKDCSEGEEGGGKFWL